jgi:protein O-GlcNAc transferase
MWVALAAAVAGAPQCPENASLPAQRAAGERLLAAGGEANAAVATACFRAVLERVGASDAQTRGEVGVLLADALEASGDIAGSAAQLHRVHDEFPMSPVPPFKLGNQARVAERWAEAVKHYEKAVSLAPTFINARTNLGMSLRGLNRLDDAIAAYRGALTVAPSRADVHVNLGVALDAAGKPEEARAAYEEGIRLDPLLYQGYFNLGVLLAESFKDREGGIQLYHAALRIAPTFADAYHTLGTVHTNMGKYDEARKWLETALAMRPDDSRFHNSLGILYDSVGDNAGALKYYQSSITNAPNSAAAIINAAKVMNSQGRFQEAENMCLEAIRVDPQYGEAYCQLGDVYKDSENIGLALQAYLQGIALTPTYDAGFCNFFYTATFACHWDRRSEHVAKLRKLMRKYLRGSDPLVHECVQPFQSLAYPLEPEELLEIARFHANKAAVHIRGIVGAGFTPLVPPHSLLTVSSARGGTTHRRLRIGFVSADYKDHPVVKDLIHMFSSFDRRQFDIFCFALNPAGPGVGWEASGWHEGGGPGPHRMWRDRAARHCNLVDVSGERDPEAAAIVNDRRMHILFNIMGYTQGERNEIFALQPAPLQVLYKGFVGTLGANYIGHMVTDARVSPPGTSNNPNSKIKNTKPKIKKNELRIKKLKIQR